MEKRERGAALGIVLLTAVVFSVASFAALAMGLSSSQRSGFYGRRLEGRNATESALVWAYQRLLRDPDYPQPDSCISQVDCRPCSAVGDVGQDALPLGGGRKVMISVEGCMVGTDRKISAKVTY